MKTFAGFILSFFVYWSCFAQDIEKSYFENHSALGGDAVIKSASFKAEKDGIYKTFEVESLGDGAYYLDAWIMAPIINGSYTEYKVVVNGIITEFTFKPQTDGWHSLALTDTRKSAVAVKLKQGINTVSVIGTGPEVPNVEFIKMSSSLSRTGISDSKYRAFIESIENGTLNEAYNNIDSQQASSGRGTNGQIYDYYLNLPYNFTQWWAFSFYEGQNISVSAGSSSLSCVIELFHVSNPESYSWSTRSTTGISNLNVTIPVGGGGYYILLIRSLNPVNMGLTTMTLDWGDGTYSTNNECIVTYSPQVAVTPKYTTPANFFTCKTGGGGTWLFLSNNMGRITAYNYNGGVTSDGYSWGLYNSRITTTLPDINYGFVFRKYVYEPNYDKCDLYMGLELMSKSKSLAVSWQTYLMHFPNLAEDNSFRSGLAANYNCIAWSVGNMTNDTDYDTYISFTTDKADGWYYKKGYIPSDSINGVIALWGYPQTYNGITDTVFTHASVRKHPQNPYPHGFEWESKLGARTDRAMHTRDALKGNEYGSIVRYYQPNPNRNINNDLQRSSGMLQSSFSASELNEISTLKNSIPTIVASDFDAKYLTWEKTWDRPENAIHSNPFMYARSSEYESLREYCMKYGKAIWPLVFDKLTQGDIYVISLLRDLTDNGNPHFGAKITRSASVELPNLYTMQVDYCKGLLAKEELNILKSIHAIPGAETEPFVLDVTANNSQEILLNMFSEKDEKAVVSIYNISGHQEYKSTHHFKKGSQKIVIRNSKFKKGIYIVHVTSGDKTTSQTINI